jgi:hypothetical protein
MRDDASRARLLEMGFELYVPRGAVPAGSAREARKRVALVARGQSALLADVARALGFAGIEANIVSGAAEVRDAAGLVVFGSSPATDAAVPQGGTPPIARVRAPELAQTRGNAAAKRALWGELRRLARELAGG